MIEPIGQKSPVCDQISWVSDASDEIVIAIFSYLNPEELSICGQTCQRWLRLSRDKVFYQTFAERFNYFDRNEGRAYFSGEEARERFLSIYKKVRGHALETSAADLPPYQDFDDPLKNQEPAIFPGYAYEANRSALYAYLHLGGAEKEKDLTCRPFFLACYFGDLEMLETIRSTKHVELKSYTLLTGAVYGVLGDQPEVVKKVKQLGANLSEPAIFNVSWSEYLMGYAKTDSMRTAIANETVPGV